MMKQIRYIIIALLFFIILTYIPKDIFAQVEVNGQTMIVSNSLDTTNPHVKIKWFIPEIYNPKGVYIYRRKPGQENWEKIINTPFQKGDFKIPNIEFDKDSTLERFVSLIDGLTTEEIQGLTLATIFIKSVQNQAYAQYIGVEYHDLNVKKGEQYQYKVTKVLPSGEEEIGISSIIKVEKYERIDPPEDIEIKAGDKQVLIKWKPDKLRFYGVNIFRRRENQQEFVKMNPIPIITSKRKGPDGVLAYADIFFTDDSLNNGVTYYYKIAGIDYFSRNSKYSKIYKVTPKDQTAPPSPKFLRNDVDLLNVTLTWENVYAPDIKGINVYRSLHHDRDFIRVNKLLLNVNTNEYIDIVEKPGKYYYYVSAVDSSGNEASSFLTMANVLDIYPPAKPKGLYSVADTGKITLYWLPNTEEDLMGYQIYRTIDRDNKKRYVLLNANPVNDTTYIDSLPLSAKNKFHYRVAAVDSAINRSEFSAFAASKMPDIIAPAQPFIKKIEVKDDNYLEIQWIANADLDLLGYNIFRENKTDSLATRIKINQSVLSPKVVHFTDRWVEQGIKYNYYLEAIDSSNNKSEYSNPFPGKLPLTKTKLKEVVKHFSVKNRGNYNILRWNINIDEEYLGSIVYRMESTGIYRPLTGLIQDEKYRDHAITPGNSYKYQVRIYSEKYGEFKSQEIEIKTSK